MRVVDDPKRWPLPQEVLQVFVVALGPLLHYAGVRRPVQAHEVSTYQ
jgi:hypothetical protein